MGGHIRPDLHRTSGSGGPGRVRAVRHLSKTGTGRWTVTRAKLADPAHNPDPFSRSARRLCVHHPVILRIDLSDFGVELFKSPARSPADDDLPRFGT